MKQELKKSLGQNFLRDESVLERIIETAKITAEDVIVEVGPGDGALTERLLATGAHIIAIEIDQDLIPQLEERFSGRENFTLLQEDIRQFNLQSYFAERKITQYAVVANLPYYITSFIIRYFLESALQPQSMTLMVQKEVGERICAPEGAMSKLSVSVQYYGVPGYAFTVPAEAFEPVPKVDSCILTVSEIARTQTGEEEKAFFRTVRAGFSARRKTLANNLKNSLHLEKEEIEALFVAIAVIPTVRAQELSITQWKKLAKSLPEKD